MLSLKSGLTHLGKYVMLMERVLSRPDRWRMFAKQYVTEMYQLGYNSIGIVLIISFFIGAVELYLQAYHSSDEEGND